MDHIRMFTSPLAASVLFLLIGGYAQRVPTLPPWQRSAGLVAFFACSLIVLSVLVKWATSEGIRDWQSGGVASIVRDDSRRLVWSDWAILLTRKGTIDIRTQRLRLETRFFLGMIPWNHVDRKLTTFDHVEAIHHYYESQEHRDGRQRTVAVYDHAVELHRADGQPLRLFDLASHSSNDASAALVNRLAGRIKTVLPKA
jgi:hypothetical protein